jgi:hypothetical protein
LRSTKDFCDLQKKCPLLIPSFSLEHDGCGKGGDVHLKISLTFSDAFLPIDSPYGNFALIFALVLTGSGAVEPSWTAN